MNKTLLGKVHPLPPPPPPLYVYLWQLTGRTNVISLSNNCSWLFANRIDDPLPVFETFPRQQMAFDYVRTCHQVGQ